MNGNPEIAAAALFLSFAKQQLEEQGELLAYSPMLCCAFKEMHI